ncbi:hypothetical protein L916_12611, partial [Phytophthora nicotianae]
MLQNWLFVCRLFRTPCPLPPKLHQHHLVVRGPLLMPCPLSLKLHQRRLFVSGILQTAWLLVAKLRLTNQVVCMLFRRLQNYLLVRVLFRM